MKEQGFNPEHQEQQRLERLSGNVSFQRFARGFEIYQKAYDDASEDEKVTIRERMLDVHGALDLDGLDQSGFWGKKKRKQLDEEASDVQKVILSVMREAEAGTFTTQMLGEAFVNAGLDDDLLGLWSHEAGEVDGGDLFYANELVAIHMDTEDEISIHIGANAVKGSELIMKIIEGFKLIAEKIKEGRIAAKKISMKSWLLAPAFEPKIRMLLGSEVDFYDVDPEDDMTKAIQDLALLYNGRSLKDFLSTGEKPIVRGVDMTGPEFVAAMHV